MGKELSLSPVDRDADHAPRGLSVAYQSLDDDPIPNYGTGRGLLSGEGGPTKRRDGHPSCQRTERRPPRCGIGRSPQHFVSSVHIHKELPSL
jgi:hypothetical protein